MTPAKTKPTAVTANASRRNITCPGRTLEMLFPENKNNIKHHHLQPATCYSLVEYSPESGYYSDI